MKKLRWLLIIVLGLVQAQVTTTPGGVTYTSPVGVANTWTLTQTFALGMVSGGTTFTLGAGTGACATTSTLTGGSTSGSFLCTGTAGASTQIVNLPTAAHAWACWASDDTSKVGWAAGAAGAAVVTLSGTIATTSDKVVFGCMGY